MVVSQMFLCYYYMIYELTCIHTSPQQSFQCRHFPSLLIECDVAAIRYTKSVLHATLQLSNHNISIIHWMSAPQAMHKLAQHTHHRLSGVHEVIRAHYCFLVQVQGMSCLYMYSTASCRLLHTPASLRGQQPVIPLVTNIK